MSENHFCHFSFIGKHSFIFYPLLLIVVTIPMEIGGFGQNSKSKKMEVIRC